MANRIENQVREILSGIPRTFMRAKRNVDEVMCGSYAGTDEAKNEIRQVLEAAGFTVAQNPHAGAPDLLIVSK